MRSSITGHIVVYNIETDEIWDVYSTVHVIVGTYQIYKNNLNNTTHRCFILGAL